MKPNRTRAAPVEPALTPAERIQALRVEIDRIDRQLVALLNRRAAHAVDIGQSKRELGWQVYQPEREREVLAHVRAISAGPLDPEALTRLFERIIDEARRLERLAVGRTGD